jgi:outer membrane receptor protein involved in Fe transport
VLEPQISDFLWFRPGFNTTTPGGTRYVNLNYTHLFSPSLISQTSISALRFYNGFHSAPSNTIPFFNWELGYGDFVLDYFGTPTAPSFEKSHNYQLHEDVTWTHGRHNVKAGFLVAHLDNYDNSAGGNSKGTDNVAIAGLCGNACMLNDLPYEYELISTISAIDGKYRGDVVGSQVLQFGGYVQDDWKVKSNLLLTLGLRWDDYGNPSSYGNGSLPWNNMISPAGASLMANIESDNISSGPVNNAFSSPQDLNFLPRVGFAWTPFPNRKLSVHGGMGLYNDAMNLGGVVNGLANNSPSQLNLDFQLFTSLPDVDPRNMFGTDANLAPPFGRTYTHPQIITDGFDTHGEPCANVGCTSITTTSLSAVYPHLSPQKTAQYNLQVEQEFAGNLIAGVGYAGSFSWNQYVGGDYNTYPGDEIANNGTLCRLPVNGVSCAPEWGSINMATGALRGNYNALMLTARQNYHRLNWQASYTWAKTLAYGGSTLSGFDTGSPTFISVVANIYDPQHYYGPVVNSVPHSFNGSVAYEFPGRSLHNLAERAVLAGWEISAVGTAQSGTPFSFVTSQVFSTSGNLDPSAAGDYLANGYKDELVNVGAGVKRKGYSRTQFESGMFGQGVTPHSAYQAGLFSNPVGYGTVPVYSNQGLNSFYGPGYLGIDSALHKKVLLPWFGSDAGSTLTLGIEASNVLNRANLGMPNSTDLANSSGWAQSTAAYQARMYQVMGKFQF